MYRSNKSFKGLLSCLATESRRGGLPNFGNQIFVKMVLCLIQSATKNCNINTLFGALNCKKNIYIYNTGIISVLASSMTATIINYKELKRISVTSAEKNNDTVA